jgi:hypothetical protein
MTSFIAIEAFIVLGRRTSAPSFAFTSRNGLLYE